MITIPSWPQYEVDSKGHAWEPGEPLRKKPLEYVRVAAHGGHWTPSYRDLLSAGGRDTATALGVFVKLLELSARQSAELRGAVRPGDVDSIQRATGFPADVIENALDILVRAGWIVAEDETPGMPESPGKAGRFLKGKGRVKERKETSAKSFAGASSTSPRGKETPPDTEGDGDPLAACPELAAFYPRLLAMIRAAHPAARLPQGDAKGRDVLAKLARLDGFPEGEIVAALSWLFQDYTPRDDFDWRQQVAAIPPLRKVKDGLSKFARIHEAWKRATAGRGAPEIEGAADWTPERIKQFEIELAAEQAGAAI